MTIPGLRKRLAESSSEGMRNFPSKRKSFPPRARVERHGFEMNSWQETAYSKMEDAGVY